MLAQLLAKRKARQQAAAAPVETAAQQGPPPGMVPDQYFNQMLFGGGDVGGAPMLSPEELAQNSLWSRKYQYQGLYPEAQQFDSAQAAWDNGTSPLLPQPAAAPAMQNPMLAPASAAQQAQSPALSWMRNMRPGRQAGGQAGRRLAFNWSF